jgi:hypothetical protein
MNISLRLEAVPSSPSCQLLPTIINITTNLATPFIMAVMAHATAGTVGGASLATLVTAAIATALLGNTRPFSGESANGVAHFLPPFSEVLLSTLTVLANSIFEGMFHFFKSERWSIFSAEQEKCFVLAVSFPTF